MASAAALTEAIARLDVRFGARTVASATSAAERMRERRFLTETSFDRLTGGIGAGSVVALVGEGTCGKVTLAMRAVAGAQRDGASALWIDGARSFDAVAAHRTGVDLERLVVVRARSGAEVLIAAGAGLRSEGFRLVVVDLGPSFAQVASPDSLSSVIPHARGSTSALLVIADAPAMRLALPTFAFERMSWERQHGRITGWTYMVSPRRDTVARSRIEGPRAKRAGTKAGPGDEHALLREAV
jgi:predicted ATP-dependent serine protease